MMMSDHDWALLKSFVSSAGLEVVKEDPVEGVFVLQVPNRPQERDDACTEGLEREVAV